MVPLDGRQELKLGPPEPPPQKPKRGRVARPPKPPPRPPKPAKRKPTEADHLAVGSAWEQGARLWEIIAGKTASLHPSRTGGLQLARCVEKAPEVVLYRLAHVAMAKMGDTDRAGRAGVLALETLRERGDGIDMLLRGVLIPTQTNATCNRLDQQRDDDLAGVERTKAQPRTSRADDMDDFFDRLEAYGQRSAQERDIIDGCVAPRMLEVSDGQR